MPGFTPIYALPYQLLGEAPDGPNLGLNLATAVEGVLARLDTPPDVQIFTANGTWTKPANAKVVNIRVQAGGGGGGGAVTTGAGQLAVGSGGEGGAYAESWFAAGALAASLAITVGLGGTAPAGAGGGAGGTSSAAAVVSAAGGAGGAVTAAVGAITTLEGGQSAQAMTGQIQIAGMAGGIAAVLGTAAAQDFSGAGGASFMGLGGTQTRGSGTGYAGRGYGGGGGGGSNSPSQGVTRSGGVGAGGIVIVVTYF